MGLLLQQGYCDTRWKSLCELKYVRVLKMTII
jgi:hypothetical protein